MRKKNRTFIIFIGARRCKAQVVVADTGTCERDHPKIENVANK